MKTKKILIIAAICLVVGIIVSVIGLIGIQFDFSRLSTNTPYETKLFTSSATVENIVIKDDNTDIEVRSTDDDEVTVTYYDSEKFYYEVTETDGEVKLIKKNSMRISDYFLGISFGAPPIVVNVPKTYSGDIDIEIGNGNITVNIDSIDDMKLKTNNRNITIKNAEITGELSANTHNGNISLQQIEANNSIDCMTNNGQIKIDDVSFEKDLICRTNNGNIKGSVEGELGDFSFDCGTHNGNCNLPQKITSGDKNMKIYTSNGDIDISFVEK